MRLKLSLLFVFISIYSWSQTTTTFTTNGSLVVPAGVTSMSVQAWGGGGAGGGASGAGLLLGRGGAGGGGGAYVSGTITVGVGATLNVVVAGQTSGTLTDGASGGSSTITGYEAVVLAAGGAGGSANTTGNTPSGGSGGTTTASFGTTKTAGSGGGNGSSALLTLGLSSGAGGNGANPTGGVGGAAISSLLLGNSPGNPGSAPGGGGSGAINSASGSPQIGGIGASGQVKITYTCPTYNITGTTAGNACATDGNSSVVLTSSAALLPLGNYTVTYNRSNPSAIGLTAAMTVTTAGTGNFTAAGLTTVGTSLITITNLASGTCSSTISTANVASLTVSGASVGGSVTGGTTICSGSTSATLALSGETGTVVKWQYSISPFSAWTDIAATAGLTSYTSGALTQTTQFRAVVQNGTCITANSAFTTVTVNPLPSAPIIGTITLPTCAVPTGAVALSGLPSGGTLTMYPGAIVKPYSGTIANVSGLSANTYTFTVSNGTCTSLNSANAIVPGLVTNTYTTSWSNGTPTVDQNLVFAGNFTSAGGGAGNINGCSCMVNSGVNILIQSSDTMTLSNALTNNGGTLTFQNNASLLQTSNAVNTGNIVYMRTSSQIILGDFVYWSSPVNPQRLVDVSPLTLSDKYLAFNNGAWASIDPNTNMVIGKGYIIRSPQNYSSTVKLDYTASFIGVPNDGNISGETVTAGNFYLVGNPYPSALNADLFLGANTFLDGTLYFWTHNTPVVLQGAYQYNSNDYASYNLSGGVGTAPAPSGNAGNNNATPSGKIAAGQSFFASANAAGTISFTNAMRLGGTNNSQFFKNGNTVKQSELETHRLWLNMTNDGGAFKQLLIAYIEGATNDNENRYDGETFDGNPYLDFYSINNGTDFVIQGRALPFQNTDVVPLGYRSTIAGDFTIAIDHAEGDLSNHAIYIEDKMTNVIHDLSTSNYTFTTATGTFKDRFVLRYTNATLGVIENEEKSQNLKVSVKDKIITINSSGDENIETVFVYDLTGQLIYKETGISSNILRISTLKSSHQMLLIKVVSDNNNTSTKKIIY